MRLAFAWVKNNQVPLILGQTNFFLEFDICFYRSQLEFEIQPRSSSTGLTQLSQAKVKQRALSAKKLNNEQRNIWALQLLN
jgi:hypothetical protein